MPTQIQNNFRVRKTFAKIAKIIDIPNLINIQKQSYEKFLQADIAPGEARGPRPSGRLQVASSRSATSTRPRSLEFVSYHLEKPKYDVDECHQRGMTYSAPIKVVVRLVVWDKDEETGAQSHPRREGAGGLLRRNPADDPERHLHHQRHRARRRQPAAPLARAPSSTTTRARATRRASCSTTPASSRTAARGSTSSSTTRTCCTCASTGAASCRPRC